jgi:hypothetical protein
VDELRRLSALGTGEGCLTPHLVDIEIPIVQERFAAPTAQVLSVVGLERKFSVPPDVVQMLAHRLEVVAIPREHFYNRFWRSLDGPADLLDLRRCEVRAGLSRASASAGYQVE